MLLFLLSALLFPDSMPDYKGYEDFFISRRAWFFGVLGATYLFDVIDTLIKGPAHFQRFGTEYLILTPLLVALCIAAALTADRRFHAAFVAFTLIYQISWIPAPVRYDRLNAGRAMLYRNGIRRDDQNHQAHSGRRTRR